MSEHLEISAGSKREKYEALLPQIEAVVAAESDPIANMANLGPFQGPMACTRIRKERGVCGTARQTNQTQVVPDVDQFPGHIACSSASKSEIVVPLHNASGEVTGVLDIDSAELNTFDETDRIYLEQVANLFH